MKQYVNPQFPHFVHGADYNPEQWMDPGIWDEDMRLMKLAGCNEMTVGIFSWAKLEPEEGKFDFSFLDEIIDRIYRNDGRVILATPSGARPRWLAEKYPEVLRVKNDGVRILFGRRHNHCYTSPVYREKVRIINTKFAERYGKHPAVIAWHLSNEYNGTCYCPLCQDAFRDYVRTRYGNEIDRLNQAWWTSFWSHDYTSFDQVEAPSPRGEISLHGLNLDFKRFSSDQAIDFMKAEADAIRAVCPELPITTNMMSEFGGIDYRKMARHLDFISWDSYPSWHSPEHDQWGYRTAFWHELFRSLKKKPFFLMESAPGLVNWQPYNKLKRPGVNRLAALQTVAMGGDSVQYFQFRKGRGGEEKLHGAIVDHVGNENTRVFREIAEIGAGLKKIDEICGTQVKAPVAILFDYENRWALEDARFFTNENKQYCETCFSYYAPLWKKGINADIVGPHDDLSGYRLVIAPMLYMTDGDTISRLTEYVARGGTLYATYFLGMVNETDLCYLGGFPANGLKDVFGIWNEELDTLYPGERVRFRMKDSGATYEGKDCCEIIHAQGAKVLAEYDSEFYKGSPMLTVNSYGSGRAYYQAARDCGDFWGTVCDLILKDLGIGPALPGELPHGVTAHRRYDGQTEYLFVQNYGDRSVGPIALGGSRTDLESGETLASVELPPFGVRVLKRETRGTPSPCATTGSGRPPGNNGATCARGRADLRTFSH